MRSRRSTLPPSKTPCPIPGPALCSPIACGSQNRALVFNTREIITQGLIQGKSVGVMASALSSRMGQSYKNAERLIRTETAHIHAEADRRAYKEAGVAEYEYMAAVNERTW